ncbi:site-specific integrase [Spiribacter salinus]|uniref:site-specific integrase n=1 Tax=Spiribacter salinus TaxID=1335746 RepID=UPI001C981A92|nr:site-specific integrase [Spiribacter salinus]
MPIVTFSTQTLRQILVSPPMSRSCTYHDNVTIGLVLEHRRSGNATWYYRYRSAEGRIRMRRIGSVEAVSTDRARAIALELMQQVADGRDPAEERCSTATSRIRLEEFVENWYVPHAKARKKVWLAERALLNHHILPVFGRKRLSSLTQLEVAQWHEGRRDMGYAAGSCNRMLILLRHIYNCAIRWQFIPDGSNPAQDVRALKGEGRGERYLSEAETTRLLQVLHDYPGRMVADIIYLLIYTGARKREVLDAQWQNIDLTRQILTVPRSKSGKPRYIHLSGAAVEVIARQNSNPGVPWLFINPKTGRPPVTIFNAWNTIRRRAGLSDVRLHDLRHSFASFLVNSGRSLYEVQALLGHSNPQTTMRYAHLSQDSLQRAVETVATTVDRCK